MYGGLPITVVPCAAISRKRDVPKSVIYQDPLYNSMTSAPNVSFGYEGNSIFRDTRVRQAMSMAIDREAFADVIENIDRFAADGIHIEWGINTHMGQTFGWLNRAILLAACAAIVLLAVSAAVMWWKRRPAGSM